MSISMASSTHIKKAPTDATANANSQNENTTKYNQLQKVFKAYHNATLSMYECEKLSGINRANICRYNKTLRESKSIYFIGKRRCTISNRIVGIYTTNPKLVPIDPQLSLFPDGL
jgi:hypothetical protein